MTSPLKYRYLLTMQADIGKNVLRTIRINRTDLRQIHYFVAQRWGEKNCSGFFQRLFSEWILYIRFKKIDVIKINSLFFHAFQKAMQIQWRLSCSRHLRCEAGWISSANYAFPYPLSLPVEWSFKQYEGTYEIFSRHFPNPNSQIFSQHYVQKGPQSALI